MAYRYPGAGKGIQLLTEHPLYAIIFIALILIIRFIYINSDDIFDKIKELILQCRTKKK